jgi:phosphate transport system ATP-binding protein
MPFQVENLCVAYANRLILRDITLTIAPQTITALVGPSGCGKSTFLKVLNRIAETEAPFQIQGQVKFAGHDIYGAKVNVTRLRQLVGMVFQQPTPFAMSIYDNVAFPAHLAGLSAIAEVVETSLKKAALWEEVKDILKCSALTLSGGQQQRLCIARALAITPQVLLLDEPCAALDPIATAKIEALLVELQQELTILIVTHNLQQAQRLATHTVTFGLSEDGVGYLDQSQSVHP